MGAVSRLQPGVLLSHLGTACSFVSPTLACVTWFGAVPYQALYLNPRKPADADSLLG